MKRRRVLKTLAASSVATVGVGTAGARSVTPTSTLDYDTLHVTRGDEIVDSVDDPSWADVRRLETDLADDQQLVSPTGSCITYCCEDCPYTCSSGCACGCTSPCCDSEEETCGC